MSTLSLSILLINLAILSVCPAKAATTLLGEGQTQIPFNVAGGRPGIWSGGAFIVVEDNNGFPVLRAADKSGQLISKIDFTIPGASLVNIYSGMFARGFDGSFALAGTAYTKDDRGAVFIAWISQDGQQQMILRSWPFIASVITMSADGSIWAAGREVLDNSTKNVDKPEYNVIRRYDRAGHLIGSFIPLSSLNVKPGRLEPSLYSYFVSSRDRVGWYSQAAHKYIEFALDGSSVGQYAIAKAGSNFFLTGAALCDDGSMVVSARTSGNTSDTTVWHVFALDRERGLWNPLQSDSKQYVMVYGCDGKSLGLRHVGSGYIDWFSMVSQ